MAAILGVFKRLGGNGGKVSDDDWSSDDDEERMLVTEETSSSEAYSSDDDDDDHHQAPPQYRYAQQKVRPQRRREPVHAPEPANTYIVRKRRAQKRPLYSKATVEKSGVTADRCLEDAIYEANETMYHQLEDLFNSGSMEEEEDKEALEEHLRNQKFLRGLDHMRRVMKTIDSSVSRLQANQNDIEQKIKTRRAVVEAECKNRPIKQAVLGDSVMLRLLRKRKLIRGEKARFENHANGIEAQVMAFQTCNLMRSTTHTQKRAMRDMRAAMPDAKAVQEAGEELDEVMTQLGVANEGIAALFEKSGMKLGTDNTEITTEEDLYQDFAEFFGEEYYEQPQQPVQRETKLEEEEESDPFVDMEMALLPEAPSHRLASVHKSEDSAIEAM